MLVDETDRSAGAYRSSIGFDFSERDIRKRGLSGAVFTDQRVDLARIER